MTSKQNHFPVEQFAQQALELFQQAISIENPARFLYEKKVRTSLFNLESLLRLLNLLFEDENTADSLKKVKKLEDKIGVIDDCKTLVILFTKNKKVTTRQQKFFRIRYDKAIEKLNKKCIEKDFYQDLFHKVLKTSNINFNNKPFIDRLRKRITQEVEKCFEFFSDHSNGFTEMESQVHEIRRKLRWISIYAQSLNGLIELRDVKTKYTWEKKFITTEERASKYNVLPVKKGLEDYIYFNKKAFLALSHVVTSLGKIKDDGLRQEILAKSILKTSDSKKAEATQLAMKQLNSKNTEKALLAQAHSLLSEFFLEHEIHQLLILRDKI